MRRIFCALLAIFLVGVLLLPTMAIVPQHKEIARMAQAVQATVGTDTPGAAAILFENGERILYEGYGYADITARTLVTAQTCFELGELSSLFVALAVQRLAEQKKLDLDRDIAYYLPGEFLEKLDLSNVITLKDLLSGHAGFADRYCDLRYENPALVFDTLEEALLADVPAQLESPGSFYANSRFGITLAAFVVESVSGTDYATYVSENILKPLGMTQTVLAPHVQEVTKMAAGHTNKGEGSFAVAAGTGRTYSALWPADGAVSCVADLCLLLQFLMQSEVGAQLLTPVFAHGVFQTGMVGLTVSGSLRGMTASTAHFSASFCMDTESANAALVLCNTADSALLRAPYEYAHFSMGVAGIDTDSVSADLGDFEGEYVLYTKAEGALLSRAVKNVQVSTDGEDALVFGDRRLVQIAPGIFADPEARDLAVLQFLTNIEGEVIGVVTFEGEHYRPAGFWEKNAVVNILFVALVIGALYFLVGGMLALFDALLSRARNERRPRAWRFTLPWVLAALHALVVLVQILVCQSFGMATIASFLTASATVSLLLVIGAVCCFVYALFTGFTVRHMTARVARSAILYLLFLLLCGYWGIVLL